MAGDRTQMTLQLDCTGEGLLVTLQLPAVGLVAKRLLGRMLDQLVTYAERQATGGGQRE